MKKNNKSLQSINGAIKRLIFVVSMGLVMSLSGVAHAGQGITATHTVVSQQPSATGLDVVVAITLTNQSGARLGNVVLDLISPVAMNKVSFGNIAQASVISKVMTVSIPGTQVPPLFPLMFDGSSADIHGAVTHFLLISEVK